MKNEKVCWEYLDKKNYVSQNLHHNFIVVILQFGNEFILTWDGMYTEKGWSFSKYVMHNFYNYSDINL